MSVAPIAETRMRERMQYPCEPEEKQAASLYWPVTHRKALRATLWASDTDIFGEKRNYAHGWRCPSQLGKAPRDLRVVERPVAKAGGLQRHRVVQRFSDIEWYSAARANGWAQKSYNQVIERRARAKRVSTPETQRVNASVRSSGVRRG